MGAKNYNHSLSSKGPTEDNSALNDNNYVFSNVHNVVYMYQMNLDVAKDWFKRLLP